MDYTIETRALTKRYGALTAVDGVSLHVKKGEIYGFLGLNGAGKTTAIRMLLGLTRPTSGEAFLDGRLIRPGGSGPWDRVGYLVEMPYAYGELSVEENLKVVARLRSMKGREAIDRIIERLALEPYRHVKARNLSLGNAQRLGLAKALIHHPDILLLDEPANGLDPAGIVEVREMLKTMAHEQGVTVFISSHILGEVARLANRIGIIHQGRLVQEIETRELETIRTNKQLLDLGDPPSVVLALRRFGLNAEPAGGRKVEAWQETDLEAYFLNIINK